MSNFVRVVMLSLVLFFFAHTLFAATPELTAIMRKDLKRYNSHFVQWKKKDFVPSVIKLCNDQESPAEVTGDFNGDGIQDTAFYGHDSKNDLVVALVSEDEKKFKVMEVSKSPVTNLKQSWIDTQEGEEHGLWMYLKYVPVRNTASEETKKNPEVKNDAFEIQYFKKSSQLYYFKDNKFVSVVSGD
jgi:hypothetical protein